MSPSPSSKSTGSQTCVVIGGTGGLGRAIAQFHADRGCKVVITGRDAERTAGIAKEIGASARGIGLDVANPETIEAALADIEHVDRLALVAVERDFNSARDYDIARARRIVTLKLIGSPEAPRALHRRWGAGAWAVLLAGRGGGGPYPAPTPTPP